MKKQLVIIGIIVLLVSVGFSGCIKPDYITIVVRADARVDVPGENVSVSDLLIEIGIKKGSLLKSPDENLTFQRITDKNGSTVAVETTFKLYREQWIWCSADYKGGYADYRPGQSVCDILEWDRVYPATDFGETYIWNVTLLLQLIIVQQ